MNGFTRRCASLAVLSLLVTTSRPARADKLQTDATLVVVGAAAAAVAITVGIVLIVTHKPSITGCVAQGADGLTLQGDGDNKSYVLHGDVASLKPGERVKVRGKHEKGNASSFNVLEVKKDYGACPARS